MIPEKASVSVIIPTYNRCALVLQTLESLAHQTYPSSRFEVILCDDGSTDGTREMVRCLELPYALRYIAQANRGRAAARNLGLENALGDLIIFLDSDMRADPLLISEHIASHQIHDRVLVRGEIRLPPEIRSATTFTSLALAQLDDVTSDAVDKDGFLPFSLCLTGNLSAAHSLLDEAGNQDEVFGTRHGWEDVEYGYRAQRLGYRMVFNQRALAWHYDYVRTLEQQGKRLHALSRSVHLLFQKYPELEGTIAMFRDKGDIVWRHDFSNVILKKMAWRVATRVPIRCGLLLITRVLEWIGHPSCLVGFLYRLILGGDIFLGYQQGLSERRRNERSIPSSEPTTISTLG